jgi:hypothetical protein
MKLPSFGNTKKQKELFLSLLLFPDAVDASAWQLNHKGEANILGSVTQALSNNNWDERNDASDKCVSTLEDITKSQNINKVILGLPAEYLTDEGDVKKEVKQHIKKLTHLLELTPIGFVSIYQAIIHHYKLKEGVPPSLILMGITSESITITLYKVGNFIGQRILPREGNLIGHLEDALASFTNVEILPSRIIIYGTNRNSLEDAKRDILQYHWQQKANFLHFPKAEVLAADEAAIAVSSAGALELAKQIDIYDDEEETVDTEIAAVGVASQVIGNNEEPIIEKHEDEIENEENQVQSDDELSDNGVSEQLTDNMLADEDYQDNFIKEDDFHTTAMDEEVHSNVETVNPEEFGFSTDESEDEDLPLKKNNTLAAVSSPINRIVAKFKTISLPIRKKQVQKEDRKQGKSKKKRNILVGSLVGSILFIIVLFVFYTNVFPKADVSITVSPQDVTAEETIQIGEAEDIEALTVSARVIEQSVNGEKTIPVTGKKIIGDPAKGSVTIFNKSLVSRTFKKGTVLSAGSVDFLLDSDVSVASASESLSEGSIIYGKTTANVTAKDIGTQGNIGAEKEFGIEGVSSSIATARNEKAFNGGTSQDIKVVSRADQDELIEQLTAELIDQAKEGFSAEEGEKMINETITTAVSEKTFSHEIGEEADELNGKATVMISGTAYNEADVKNAVAEKMNDQIPEGYKLSIESLMLSFETPEITESGEITVNVTVTGKAVPSIDVDQLASTISGMSIEQATEEIMKNNGVENVVIVVTRALRKNMLPKNEKNITISIGAN